MPRSLRQLVFALIFLVAGPASAQSVSPDTVLASIWMEALFGAELIPYTLTEALELDSLVSAGAIDVADYVPVPIGEESEPMEGGAERLYRRPIISASHAAAAAGTSLGLAMQMQIALTEPERQAEVEAELAEPVMALYMMLVTLVDTSADVAEMEGPLAADTRAELQRIAEGIDAVIPMVKASLAR